MNKYLLFFALFISSNAMALQSFYGKVTVLEPTYYPDRIKFKVDNGSAICPKGTWLTWKKTEKNNQVVYSTLMDALASGKKIRFYHDDECIGKYIHLLNN